MIANLYRQSVDFHSYIYITDFTTDLTCVNVQALHMLPQSSLLHLLKYLKTLEPSIIILKCCFHICHLIVVEPFK